jgi:hypothetical protein
MESRGGVLLGPRVWRDANEMSTREFDISCLTVTHPLPEAKHTHIVPLLATSFERGNDLVALGH